MNKLIWLLLLISLSCVKKEEEGLIYIEEFYITKEPFGGEYRQVLFRCKQPDAVAMVKGFRGGTMRVNSSNEYVLEATRFEGSFDIVEFTEVFEYKKGKRYVVELINK